MSENSLLVIDDDLDVCLIIKSAAESCGFRVDIAQDHPSFRENYTKEKPSVIILDLYLIDTDGVEIIQHLKDGGYDGHILLISGKDSKLLALAELIGKENQLNMLPSIEKPIKISQLQDILKTLLSSQPFVAKNSILEAIEGNKLLVCYEPKISIDQNKVVGVEASIHWNYKGSAIVYPDSFIPLAEQTGVINRLTEWLINKIFSDRAKWLEQNIDLGVSINISAKLLAQSQFPQFLITKTKELAIHPERFTLEITEAEALALTGIALDAVTKLRDQGFLIAIDGLGAGYSSLISLYKVPFSELKIDKHFIRTMEKDSTKEMVKSMVNLGHDLGMKVVAEGVETVEILKMLQTMGCDEAQGCLFSQALPADQLLEWLQNMEARG